MTAETIFTARPIEDQHTHARVYVGDWAPTTVYASLDARAPGVGRGVSLQFSLEQARSFAAALQAACDAADAALAAPSPPAEGEL